MNFSGPFPWVIHYLNFIVQYRTGLFTAYSLCRYYHVTINVGQPPKPYFFDIDTGSDLTWLQCDAPCAKCTPVFFLFDFLIYLISYFQNFANLSLFLFLSSPHTLFINPAKTSSHVSMPYVSHFMGLQSKIVKPPMSNVTMRSLMLILVHLWVCLSWTRFLLGSPMVVY